MYDVYADGTCIYSDTYLTQNTKALSPKLSLEDNSAGSLSITLPPQNAGYSLAKRLSSKITVTKEGTEIWSGRIINETEDFWKNRKLTCEGELAYLNDTIQPPAEYHDITVRGFLETLLNIHNSKSTERFEVGAVTVYDSNDSIYRYTNYESTLSCINEKLINRLGGHLRIRKENGVRYLDYLDEYPNLNKQEIRFGVNLLDFVKSWDLTQLATVIVPRGARLEESPIEALEAYTTVEGVNGGSIYVVSDDAVAEYGRIEAVVDWDDVSEPANLLKKAQEYLKDVQFEEMVLEVTAVDLHYLTKSQEGVKLLDEIRCISKPHGMDRVFPVTKLEIPLDEPHNTAYTLGGKVKTSLTSQSKQTNEEIKSKIENIPSKSSILKQAKENATQIINSAMNGYITITRTDTGTDELYISNNPDIKKSTKLWRWNINGLGYSDDGGLSYGLAMTMDGAIVADYITAGTFNADLIRAGVLQDKNGNVKFNLETGVLTMTKGSINIGNGVFSVTESGYLTATSGKIGGFNIDTNCIWNERILLDNLGFHITSNNGITVGYVGYSYWAANPNNTHAIAFNLETDCTHMWWAHRDKPEDESYTVKLAYFRGSTPKDDIIQFGCNIDGNDYIAENFWLNPYSSGFDNAITDILYIGGWRLDFRNGGLVSADQQSMSSV